MSQDMGHAPCEGQDPEKQTCGNMGCAGKAHEDHAPAEDSTVSLTRRRLFKGAAATAGLIAAGVLPALFSALPASGSESGSIGDTGDAPHGEGGTGIEHIVENSGPVNYPGRTVDYADPPGDEKWAMVIDVGACVGCRKCVYACVKENNIGRTSGFTYIQVLEMELGSNELELGTLDYKEGGKPDKWYLPIQCMHCAKPTCVYGCPVKATWREPDGIVLIDYDKCIACRNCLVTCPYDARHFNWVEPEVPKNEINPTVPLHEKESVVEKCTFCVQRTRNGETTACTEVCPVGARTFGDLNDPDSAVSTILRTKRTFRLKEELGNEPAIWYVG